MHSQHRTALLYTKYDLEPKVLAVVWGAPPAVRISDGSLGEHLGPLKEGFDGRFARFLFQSARFLFIEHALRNRLKRGPNVVTRYPTEHYEKSIPERPL